METLGVVGSGRGGKMSGGGTGGVIVEPNFRYQRRKMLSR